MLHVSFKCNSGFEKSSICSNPLESTCGLRGLSCVHSISHYQLGIVYLSSRFAFVFVYIIKKHVLNSVMLPIMHCQ